MSDESIFSVASLADAGALQRRVAALQEMAVLDTPPEEGFDALTRLAANVCETPIALISLIDGSRLWFKSTYGLTQRSIDSEGSFCCEVANSKRTLEVSDPRLDPRFANNGLVTGNLGIRYYAAAPIIYHDIGIGTMCVLDVVPRKLGERPLRALAEMASIATVMLTARVDAFRLLATSR